MKGKFVNYLLLIIPALFIPLIISHKTVDPALLPKYVAFSIYLFVFNLIILYKIIKGNLAFDAAIFKNNIFKYYLGYILISGLTLLYTRNLPDGIFEATKIFLFFNFLASAILFFKTEPEFINMLCKLIALLSLIITSLGLFQFYQLANSTGITHNSTYQVNATFANRNLFAEILLLTVPFLTMGAFKLRKAWKAICIYCLLISLFLITATLTRAVWIGALVSCIITSIFYFTFTFRRSEKIKLKRILLPGLIITFSICAAIFFYARLDTGQTFEKQVNAISNLKYGGANERIELWKKSFSLIREKPVMGVGLATWKIEVLKFNVLGVQSEDAVTFYQYPHNDFIMVLTETGVFGLLFYLHIFIAVIYYLIVILKNTVPSDHLLYLLMLFGIIAYGTVSMFSFPKERMEQNILLMLMFIPIIIKYHQIRSKKTDQRVKAGSGRIILILFLIPALLISGFSVLIGKEKAASDMHVLKALVAKQKNNWQDVIKHINNAMSPYYEIDPMSTPLAWYRGTAHFNLGRYDDALADFKKAYSINPYHVHVLNNLGTCYELKKDHRSAIECFTQALKINPVMEDAIINLSASYFNAGQIVSAYLTIRRCKTETTNQRYHESIPLIVSAKFKLIQNSLTKDHLPAELYKQQKHWLCRKKKLTGLNDEKFEQLYISTVNKKIKNFLSDQAWMVKIHAKSVENKLSLEEQVFIDSYFILNNIKL